MQSRLAGSYECVDHTKLTACPGPSGVLLVSFWYLTSPLHLYPHRKSPWTPPFTHSCLLSQLVSAVFSVLLSSLSSSSCPCPLGLGIITRCVSPVWNCPTCPSLMCCVKELTPHNGVWAVLEFLTWIPLGANFVCLIALPTGPDCPIKWKNLSVLESCLTGLNKSFTGSPNCVCVTNISVQVVTENIILNVIISQQDIWPLLCLGRLHRLKMSFWSSVPGCLIFFWLFS